MIPASEIKHCSLCGKYAPDGCWRLRFDRLDLAERPVIGVYDRRPLCPRCVGRALTLNEIELDRMAEVAADVVIA